MHVAKPERRGGLGRGLGSLLPGSYESPAPVSPAPERQRVTIEVDEEAAREAPVSTRPVRTMVEIEEEPVKVSEPIVREAIIEESRTEEVPARGTDEVEIDRIAPNPDQPRTQFKKEEIEELAASIEKDGLLQPILVRQMADGTYQIIAGERRWQASKAAGLKKVPVRVKEVDDDQALELALIENIQRSDLNPIEEAYGYRRLMERRSMTQAEVAQAVSKGRSTVANALRLLDLPEEAQQLLFEEKITAGHARAILSVPTLEGKKSLTNKLMEEKLSVRETEAIARLLAGREKAASTPSSRVPTPQSFKKAARSMSKILELPVRVKTVQGKNKIEIQFKDEDELQRVVAVLSEHKN